MIFRNWFFLANNLTPSERALEPAIAALGKPYRAQWLFPRFRHIVDFLLLDSKTIIEVDGASHEKPEQRRKDIIHTLALEGMGYKVVRVSNAEAEADPFGVIATLADRVAARPSHEALREALAALPEPPPKKSKRKPAPRAKKARRPSGTQAARTA